MVRRTLTLLLCGLGAASQAAEGPKAVSFRDDVAPIFVRNCLGCHNEVKSAGGLNMTTFALLKRGGKSGGTDILLPGDPEGSGLIESVGPDASPRMPYKLPPLSGGEIRTLETWVRQGAKFDGPSEAETPIRSLVDPLRGLPKVALKAPASDPVTSLAFSPDGATLAAAVGRNLVLFDAATGKERARLADHPGPVNSVRYFRNGARLVAAGGRAGMFGAVTVWDPAAGTRLLDARGHADAVLAAEVSPDGKTLATAGYDRLVILWDLATLRPVRVLKEHTDAVYALAFSPDGKALASAGADRTVKLWDVASGTRGATLSDATAELYAVAFGPDGGTVYAGGVDRSIRAWRVADPGAPLARSAFAHQGPVLRLAASADGKTLVSSGEDRGVTLWDLKTLDARKALPAQPDWPQAVALDRDAKRLAVGRYDGSVGVYDAAKGTTLLTLHAAPSSPAPKPELVRNASLNPPSPRGAVRGGTVRLTLTGNGVGGATQVALAEPGLSGKIVRAGKADPNRLDVDLTIAPDARVGLHRLGVVTPLGVPALQAFSVEAARGVTEAEPNDDPGAGPTVEGPATLIGVVEKPGDVDHFRFRAKAGQHAVFALTARPLGSGLVGALSVVDEAGRTLAEAPATDGARDPMLTFEVPRDGVFALRVADADYGGSGNHFYRVSAGTEPVLRSVFPLGLPRGATTRVGVDGVNLHGAGEVALEVAAAVEPGTLREVRVGTPEEARPFNRRVVVVAEGPQGVEAEPNDDPEKAGPVGSPGGVSGRIGRVGDVDHFRFEAKKGERRIVEVFGRRLGTLIDPVIEILDARGRLVPRAVLRPVAETEVAFRDHPSAGTGIRLTKWNNLAVNDTVLIGREVTRVFALPKNPDDDCQFWGEQGQRVGLLETTPEHHPMAQPVYKVEVHPPGTTFPPGGVAPVTLDYRNDDGGPPFDKDSRLTFDPPADGPYTVRVADVRGLGGEGFGYHLVVRPPRPGFTAAVSPESPAVPRGGTALVTVTVTRRDGFDGPVDVHVGGLPAGVHATDVRVDRDATTALLGLTADPDAPAFSPPTWTATARASGDSGALPKEVALDPGGPAGGWVVVTPEANLSVSARPTRVVIRPGAQVSLGLSVARGPAFTGRVPIDVRNLPQGVRVLNIGLNGVLVTEKESARTVQLFAEPWAEAMVRPFYAVGKAESAGTEHSSAPIVLVVEPAPNAPATASASAPSPSGPR